jgi:hypothetical protein
MAACLRTEAAWSEAGCIVLAKNTRQGASIEEIGADLVLPKDVSPKLMPKAIHRLRRADEKT